MSPSPTSAVQRVLHLSGSHHKTPSLKDVMTNPSIDTLRVILDQKTDVETASRLYSQLLTKGSIQRQHGRLEDSVYKNLLEGSFEDLRLTYISTRLRDQVRSKGPITLTRHEKEGLLKLAPKPLYGESRADWAVSFRTAVENATEAEVAYPYDGTTSSVTPLSVSVPNMIKTVRKLSDMETAVSLLGDSLLPPANRLKSIRQRIRPLLAGEAQTSDPAAKRLSKFDQGLRPVAFLAGRGDNDPEVQALDLRTMIFHHLMRREPTLKEWAGLMTTELGRAYHGHMIKKGPIAAPDTEAL